MTLYLDASPLVAVLAAEDSSARVAAIIAGNPERISISDFGAGEVAAALSRHVRTGRLSSTEAGILLQQFDAWQTQLDVLHVNHGVIARATGLVRRSDLKLRLPNAIHLAICTSHALTLVTGDTELAAAADAVGATVIVP